MLFYALPARARNGAIWKKLIRPGRWCITPFANVSSAQEQDGQAGVALLWQLEEASDRLKLIRADQSYRRYFKACAGHYQWPVESTQKPESQQGFITKKPPLPLCVLCNWLSLIYFSQD